MQIFVVRFVDSCLRSNAVCYIMQELKNDIAVLEAMTPAEYAFCVPWPPDNILIILLF